MGDHRQADGATSRRSYRVALALVAVAVVLVGATVVWRVTRPDASICPRDFPGQPCTGTMYFGAAVEGGDPAPLEQQLGRRITLFRSFMQASDPPQDFVARAKSDVAAGRIPLISTKLPGSWADVAAGRYDDWLTARIKALATVDGPVWLVLHHEPQGDGSPADWVAMQQHARTLIDALASNIALVGILNGSTFLLPGGDPQAYRMPVGSGVDVMGFDSYNQWSPTNGRAWQTAAQVLSPAERIAQWGYPVVVGEFGVRDDPTDPGRAAQWLADAYQYGLDHGVVGMAYFDSGVNAPDGTWGLDGARLRQFGADLSRPQTASLSP